MSTPTSSLFSMIFPASALLLACAVSGSSHALVYRQDGGGSDIVPVDGMFSWFSPSINVSIGTPPQTFSASIDLVYRDTRVMLGAFETVQSSTFRSKGNVTLSKSQDSRNQVTVPTATDQLAVGNWSVKDAAICESPPGVRGAH